MRKFGLLFLIVLSLFSCNVKDSTESFNPFDETLLEQAKEITVNNIYINKEEFINRKFYEKEVFKYSEIFTEVEYVILQTTEEANLGTIDKMIITETDEFILFDKNNGCIARFDAQGNFQNHIGQRGHASNEYIMPYTIQYSPSKKHLFVSDRVSLCLKEYALDGTFIKSIKTGYPMGNFGIINENCFASFSHFDEVPKPKEMAYNIKIHDFEGNLLAQYAPYGADKKDYNIISSMIYQNIGNELRCNEIWSSLIYTFEGISPKPLYNLNFGKEQIPPTMLKNALTPNEVEEWQKKHPSLYCQQFFDNPNYYVMRMIYDQEIYVTFIQKKNNTTEQLVKIYGYNDLKGALSNNYFLHSQNDKLYYVYEPYEIKEQLEMCVSNKEYVQKTGINLNDSNLSILKNLANSNNLVIQICTLK